MSEDRRNYLAARASHEGAKPSMQLCKDMIQFWILERIKGDSLAIEAIERWKEELENAKEREQCQNSKPDSE